MSGVTRTQPPAAAEAILENLSTAVVIVDRASCIEYMNASSEALFGISRRQAGQRPLGALVPGLDELTELVQRALAEEHSFGCDLSLVLPQRDHLQIEVACRIAPLTDVRDRAIAEFFDATQSRQLDREKALIRQRSVSQRIIRQLAHEVRNPLGGLRGAAQLLERQLDTPELKEYTQVIIGEADRLKALTENLLGPTRPIQRFEVNIHELTERVLRLLEAEAPGGISLVRDYDPSLPTVEADRDQIMQAFLNIARNAVQAMGDSGRLTLRTRVLTNFVIGTEQYRLVASIEFEDDGPGIAREIEDSIFYPLVTDRADGTGLGLPLAQDCIHRHGGLIEFQSDPGRTVFTVRLPIGVIESRADDGTGA